MISGLTFDSVPQHALAALTATFITQEHSTEYAKLAAAALFQADLELRNAQLTHLFGWLQQEHSARYK